MLEPKVRPYTGVDLSQVIQKKASDKGEKCNGWWTRMFMGFSPSPYFVTKDMLIVEKLVRGEILETKNAFRWKMLILIFPCLQSTTPDFIRYIRRGQMDLLIPMYVGTLMIVGRLLRRFRKLQRQLV